MQGPGHGRRALYHSDVPSDLSTECRVLDVVGELPTTVHPVQGPGRGRRAPQHCAASSDLSTTCRVLPVVGKRPTTALHPQTQKSTLKGAVSLSKREYLSTVTLYAVQS